MCFSQLRVTHESRQTPHSTFDCRLTELTLYEELGADLVSAPKIDFILLKIRQATCFIA